ncbi:hypothetical protein NMG60_11004253 [Bertholletia excelsa]
MAGTSSLHLLVVLLCFSFLFSFNNAVPVTRTRTLMQESQDHGLPENTHLENAEERLLGERTVGRMDLEINDYPGSGANNKHTPNPKPWRGCSDC